MRKQELIGKTFIYEEFKDPHIGCINQFIGKETKVTGFNEYYKKYAVINIEPGYFYYPVSLIKKQLSKTTEDKYIELLKLIKEVCKSKK